MLNFGFGRDVLMFGFRPALNFSSVSRLLLIFCDILQSVDIEQSSSSQPSLQISNPTNAHFVAPAPPASAPATVSSFAMGGTGVGQDIGPQSHGQTGVTRLDGPDETLSKFPLRTSSSVSMTANSPSATHSRSPSVSSTSFSSFGPLSASTSSSASSSFGEFSTSITPRRAMRLSNLDRRALCQYAEANPRVKHEHIGSMFGVERSTVSKILKQKAKWFSVSDDNTIPVSPTTERKTKDGKAYKNRIGRYPEMEAMLLEWGKEQTRSDIVLTDEAVRSKALEFAEQLNIESGSFKASAGWLENFKERAKYKAGKFDLDAPPPSLNQSSASSRGPSEELIEGGVPATENIANTLPPGSIELIDRPDVLREGIRSDNLPSHMQPAQTSSSRAPSPLRHRRHKRGGLSSLSSSSISLPDLVEQEERQSINMSKPGSTTDLRSRGSSFSNLSMRPLTQTSKSQPLSSTSYSTDSSPYPSPTCSTTSDLSQRGLTASSQTATADFVAHTSTPTQRAVYDGAYTPQSGEYHYQEMHSTAPSGSRLQQAGINFNLSLNSSPSLHSHQQHHHLPTIEAGQPLHVRHLSTPYAEGPALSSLQQYPSDAYQGDTLYATRSRIHSAPGASLQPQQTYSLNHGDDLAGHSLAYHYGQADATSPAHQVQHAVPEHKAPLHRSQTDPMPLYPNMSTSDFVGPNSSTKHLGDSTVVPTEPPRGGDTSSMQVDIVQHSSQDGPTQFYHHPYVPQVGHVYAQIPHARRATVSSGGDLSFSSGSGTGSSHGHGYSYSLSAVTTPVYGTFAAADASVVHPTAPGENNKVSLHEAYLSLRRVVAFLQDNNKPEPPRAIFATSSQTEVLESVLAQLKQAHIDQIPTLTPPKS